MTARQMIFASLHWAAFARREGNLAAARAWARDARGWRTGRFTLPARAAVKVAA